MHHCFRLATPLTLAAMLALAALPAAADRGGSEASNRAHMRMPTMDMDKDGRISKSEFLDMVGKVWDGHMPDFKSADGKLTPEQVQAIQKTLSHPIAK